MPAAAVGFVLSYALVSTAHVVLGELTPKSLAIARTERTGLVLAPPMRLFYLVTRPAVDALNWMGNALLKPFGIPPASEAGHVPHTERELRTLIEQSEQAGILDPEERSFTEGVLSFGDRRAREVMVPRRQVRVLRSDQPVPEAGRVAADAGHNRLPLCDETGNLDSATQVVHTLSLLDALAGDRRPDPDTLVLADGFSCRTQVEHGTGRRPMHLAEALAAAPPERGLPWQRQPASRAERGWVCWSPLSWPPGQVSLPHAVGCAD